MFLTRIYLLVFNLTSNFLKKRIHTSINSNVHIQLHYMNKEQIKFISRKRIVCWMCFNVHLELYSRLLLMVWDLHLRLVWRHLIMILTFYGEDGSSFSVAELLVLLLAQLLVEHLKAAQINEDHKLSHNRSFHRPIKVLDPLWTNWGEYCLIFGVKIETELINCSSTGQK